MITSLPFISIDPSLSTKPSLEHFWNLESLGITDLPSQNDEYALEKFSKTNIYRWKLVKTPEFKQYDDTNGLL